MPRAAIAEYWTGVVPPRKLRVSLASVARARRIPEENHDVIALGSADPTRRCTRRLLLVLAGGAADNDSSGDEHSRSGDADRLAANRAAPRDDGRAGRGRLARRAHRRCDGRRSIDGIIR